MALTTDPRPQLTAVDVIQDKQRMKRLKAALCSGILEYASESAATKIMEECLKVCGGSAETLSKVVQQKLIADHTPFHWTLVKGYSPSAVPPLFAKLVLACDNLLPDTQEEIIAFIHKQYDDGLYAAVKSKITASGLPAHDLCNNSFFEDPCDQPSVRVSSRRVEAGYPYSVARKVSQTVYFNIPKFTDRLIVDEEVWIQFLAIGSLLRLKAEIVPPEYHQAHSRLQFGITALTDGELSQASVELSIWVDETRGSRDLRLSFAATLYGGNRVDVILRRESSKDTELTTLIESGRNIHGTLTITAQ